MSLDHINSQQVLTFRYQRMKNSANSWLFWIALFTGVNGILLMLNNPDTVLVAGLIVPFLWSSFIGHFIAAAIFLVLGFLGRKEKPLLTYVGVAIYAVDLLYTLAISFVSAAIFHVVVLAFIVFTIWRTQALANQLKTLYGINPESLK
jgi:uncharacterized membrane protein YagU involved in acid resistance